MDGYARQTSIERTVREQSVAADHLVVEEQPDGRRTKVEGRFAYDDDAYLEVHEWLERDDRDVERPLSSSHVFVEGEGEKTVRWDFDPRHNPAAHVHRGGADEREPFERVSLKRALELGWEARSQAAEAEGASTITRPPRPGAI
jgi:hypothetical protein